MTKLFFTLVILISATAQASDYSHECIDASGMYTYYPDTQELIFNNNEAYNKSSYNVNFYKLENAVSGSCTANDGKTYPYSNTIYKIKIQYKSGSQGATDFTCELATDSLPAALSCVD